MAAPEAPPEGPSRGGGLLDKLTGRVTALVLVVLAIGVLVVFLNSGEEDEGPRSRSVPVAERVSVPTPLALAPDHRRRRALDRPGRRRHHDPGSARRQLPRRPPARRPWAGTSAAPSPDRPGRRCSPPTSTSAASRAPSPVSGRCGRARRSRCTATTTPRPSSPSTASSATRRTPSPPRPSTGRPTTARFRLITCGGVFDERTRSYEDNIVVFGHLTGAYRPA